MIGSPDTDPLTNSVATNPVEQPEVTPVPGQQPAPAVPARSFLNVIRGLFKKGGDQKPPSSFEIPQSKPPEEAPYKIEPGGSQLSQ